VSNFERKLRQSPNYIHARIKPREPIPVPIREERHTMAMLDPTLWDTPDGRRKLLLTFGVLGAIFKEKQEAQSE
jgi:hypothetical protein